MKRLVFILKFVSLFLLFYWGMYFVLFNISWGDKPLVQKIQEKTVLDKDVFGKSWKEFDRAQKYDFVFLGSSHCYRCFDPAFFAKQGLTSFNLGSSSQTPLNSFVVLDQITENARAVLLEIYPVASGLSGEESFLSMNASVEDYDLLAKSVWHLQSLRCCNALSIKPFMDHYNQDKPYNITNSRLGYVERNDTFKLGAVSKPQVLNGDYLNVQKKYIERIIELCEANDIKVALVYAPVPSELIIGGEVPFIKFIDSVCVQRKIPFYNFGRRHDLKSDQHFFDRDHLNRAGVEIFNDELLQRIAGDAAYFRLSK